MDDIYINLRWEKQPGYILEKVKRPSDIGRAERDSCIRAIIWQLSKAPHSIEEIADHFEISPELVKTFLTELIATKRVVRLADSKRYQATGEE
jgi:predicted transcriptional regulator